MARMPGRHVGDKVIVPWRAHRHGTDVIGGWHQGEVTATRKGRVLVLSYGREQEYPAYEVLPYPRYWRDWPEVA